MDKLSGSGINLTFLGMEEVRSLMEDKYGEKLRNACSKDEVNIVFDEHDLYVLAEAITDRIKNILVCVALRGAFYGRD